MRRNSEATRRLVTLAMVAGLAAAAVVTVPAPSGASATWTVSPSPSPFRPNGAPQAAVSCASPTMCFAVGFRPSIDVGYGLSIEGWDGTTWSVVARPPSPSGATLSAVSCTSATSCIAVGRSDTGALIGRWDGTSWSIAAGANPSGATGVVLNGVLNGVSCTSASNCFAVGNYTQGGKTKTLTERYNGTGWKVVPSPNPSAAISASFAGVSCRNATSCFAVGGHVERGDNKGGALVERWNGKSWTTLSTPTPKVRGVDALLSVTPNLTSVSCASLTSCFAVGYTASDALVERWTGTKWVLATTPKTTQHYAIAELRSVSCAAPTDCTAVGVTFLPVDFREGAEHNNSVAEHWNGKAWSFKSRPREVPFNQVLGETGQLSELSGVSCPTTKSCAAVGNSAMAERWDGAEWSLAPLAGAGSYSSLSHVACPGPTTCFAVGTAETLLGVSANTLIEQWNGTSWSIVPSPTASGINAHSVLNSISCTGLNDCTAVGTFYAHAISDINQATGQAIIEHWNGTAWSAVLNPTPSSERYGSFNGVSCTSATDCSAVGTYDTRSGTGGDTNHLLAEHWNGTTWSIVPIPGPDTAMLNGVSCASATSCFAVGATSTGTALIDRWNGTSWSIATSPTPNAGTSFTLASVSCPSATSCTAVGTSQGNTVGSGKTLVEHWDGTSWTVTPSPSPASSSGPTLTGVSCATTTSCTAVGNSGATQLIEQWDGATWTIVPATLPSDTIGSVLNGVTCQTAATCVAVGARSAPDGGFTLVEQSS